MGLKTLADSFLAFLQGKKKNPGGKCFNLSYIMAPDNYLHCQLEKIRKKYTAIDSKQEPF